MKSSWIEERRWFAVAIWKNRNILFIVTGEKAVILVWIQVGGQVQWWEDEVDFYWLLLILSMEIEVSRLRMRKEDREVR